MFTGIIQELVKVASVSLYGGCARFEIVLRDVSDILIGESICVNGVCLTVTAKVQSHVSFDLVEQTLKLTTLKNVRPSDKVNIERALKVSDRIGGHLVTGHIDGISKVLRKENLPGRTYMWLLIPEGCQSLIVKRGSVAVDGVSLTVADIAKDDFAVALIPHTLENTTLGFREPGDEVNIETDLIGKYVLRALGMETLPKGITEDWLKAKGF